MCECSTMVVYMLPKHGTRVRFSSLAQTKPEQISKAETISDLIKSEREREKTGVFSLRRKGCWKTRRFSKEERSDE